ncbi:MAG: fimbria major subunit [Tannerellaceae bacterium]|nr:fimbria major subunit [Tannerellaceae bacterium]
MKRKSIKLYWMGILSCFLWACSNEPPFTDLETPQENDEEKTWIQIRIQDAAFSTYASTIDDYPHTYERLGMNYPLDLYIFTSGGIFDKHLQLPLTQIDTYTYQTDPFEYITGQCYFYAFANALPGQIPTPASGMNRLDFEKSTFNFHPDSLWNGSRGLVMGTLVGTSTMIGMSSNSSPETIYLPIGRIASKVQHSYNEVEIKGDLKGRATYPSGNRPAFTMLNKAQKVYVVGQWEGGFRQLGSQVISPHFYGYVPADIDIEYEYPSRNSGIYTYTVENTNQVPTTRNSTTFLVRYTYTPDISETYDVNHPDQLVTTAITPGHTFFVAVFENGQWLIYKDDPENIVHPVYNKPVYVREYRGGVMLYKIPVADMTEKTPSLRYATIRNHYYELKVLSISALGATEEEINEPEPEIPLEIDGAIEFEIEVKEWEPVNIEVAF